MNIYEKRTRSVDWADVWKTGSAGKYGTEIIKHNCKKNRIGEYGQLD